MNIQAPVTIDNGVTGIHVRVSAKAIAGEVVIRNAIAKTIKCQCRNVLLIMKTRSTVAPKTYRFKAYKPL